MTSEASLEEYMGKAVGHYSSLFSLPSHPRILLLISIVYLSGGTLVVLPVNPSPQGLVSGLFLGVYLLFVTLLTDLAINRSFLRNDPIFDLRRCIALSLFSCLVWLPLLFLGSIISGFLGNSNLWAKFFLLGFCAALILRLLVFSTASFVGRGRAGLSALLQPALFTLPLLFLDNIVGYSLDVRLLSFALLSILIAAPVVSIFVFLVNRVGEKNLGVASIPLFKAFIANWTENLNAPLERIFESIGHEGDIKVSLLAFRAKGKVKALVVVPALHSGPFKNVGSSLIPHTIQAALENKLGCVVSVPHGLSGHELDLTSHLQVQRVLEGLLGSVNFSTFRSGATLLVRTESNEAKASCQIFGDCAFVTLTTAPQTMEDLPQELGFILINEAERRGLSSAIVVDAHNSIEGPFDPGAVLDSLRKAAVMGVERALLCSRYPFEVGAAKGVLEGFGLMDGFGPGGVSVLVTRVSDQRVAYVTIDGNNMVSGLRERILLALREVGIEDGEVFTTDTHAVNGVVLTKRGYYPIGEAIDQSRLIDCIRQAAVSALNNLEPAEASWRTVTIPNVKTMGERQIEALCLTVEEAARVSKRVAVSLFSAVGVLLVALLVIL